MSSELRRKRPWTTHEEQQLVRLEDVESESWNEIASLLLRSVEVCKHHYYRSKQGHESLAVDWMSELDQRINHGRRRTLSCKDIALETESVFTSDKAVTDRWNYLHRSNRVPEDVLAIHRRKSEVVWIADEDEAIARCGLLG
jgi:hypothetical protein